MPKVVQPDRREVSLPHQHLEVPGDEFWVQGGSVRSRKHQGPRSPSLTRGAPLQVLCLPVRTQHRHGPLIERHQTLAPSLRLGHRGAVAELHDLAGDDDLPVLEVDVDPRQSDGLASAQPAEGDEVEQGVEPVVGDGVEEGSGLGRCPDGHHRW
jgi:hypothetical protein